MKHGTTYGYQMGCRSTCCREVYNTYHRNYYREYRRGIRRTEYKSRAKLLQPRLAEVLVYLYHHEDPTPMARLVNKFKVKADTIQEYCYRINRKFGTKLVKSTRGDGYWLTKEARAEISKVLGGRNGN